MPLRKLQVGLVNPLAKAVTQAGGEVDYFKPTTPALYAVGKSGQLKTEEIPEADDIDKPAGISDEALYQATLALQSPQTSVKGRARRGVIKRWGTDPAEPKVVALDDSAPLLVPGLDVQSRETRRRKSAASVKSRYKSGNTQVTDLINPVAMAYARRRLVEKIEVHKAMKKCTLASARKEISKAAPFDAYEDRLKYLGIVPLLPWEGDPAFEGMQDSSSSVQAVESVEQDPVVEEPTIDPYVSEQQSMLTSGDWGSYIHRKHMMAAARIRVGYVDDSQRYQRALRSMYYKDLIQKKKEEKKEPALSDEFRYQSWLVNHQPRAKTKVPFSTLVLTGVENRVLLNPDHARQRFNDLLRKEFSLFGPPPSKKEVASVIRLAEGELAMQRDLLLNERERNVRARALNQRGRNRRRILGRLRFFVLERLKAKGHKKKGSHTLGSFLKYLNEYKSLKKPPVVEAVKKAEKAVDDHRFYQRQATFNGVGNYIKSREWKTSDSGLILPHVKVLIPELSAAKEAA